MNCFICNETLTEINASDEHIILNSLGGHLHSKNLLCKKCNSKLGNQADAALAETLKFAASQLNVKRCRGENQIIRTNEKEKYDLAPGYKPVLKQPETKVDKLADGKVEIKINARNTQETRKILKSLQKQYPALDIEKAMMKAQRTQTFCGSPIRVTLPFYGKRIFPSIAKTAVEFYLLRGENREEIKHLIPWLLGEEEKRACWFYYPEVSVIPFDKKEICHVICVVGDADKKLLYGYVDFFGILQCLILLNDQYSGGNYCESYVYDVNEVKKLEKNPILCLERDEIQRILLGNEISWADGLKQQLILFQQKSGEIIKERILKDMWNRVMDNFLRKYPEDTLLSEEMLVEMVDEMEKEIIPWYVSRICEVDL